MKEIILTIIMMSALSSVCFAQLMKAPPKYAAGAAKRRAAPEPMASTRLWEKLIQYLCPTRQKGPSSLSIVWEKRRP